MINPKEAHQRWGVDLVHQVGQAIARVKQAVDQQPQLQAMLRMTTSDIMETVLFRRLCETLQQHPELAQQPNALRIAALKALGQELSAKGFRNDLLALAQQLKA